MAKGGQVGGQGGPIKRGAWIFVAACIALAVSRGAFTDPKAFLQDLVTKADQVNVWVTDLVANFGGEGAAGGAGSSAGTATDPTAVQTAHTELGSIAVAADQDIDFSRDEWQHWDNVGSSCWNVRDEVLYRDAEPGSVTLLDRDKHPTNDKAAACYVAGGTWVDPYTGSTFTNPEDLDIDHVVPLGAAARSGGQAWDADRKRNYANYLESPLHLRAVSASANRAKSDQTPETWKPSNQADWCNYGVSWADVKYRWQLTMTPGEKGAVEELLATC